MDSNFVTRREFLRAGLLVAGAAGAAAAVGFWGPPLARSQPLSQPYGGLPWESARRILAETSIPTFPDATFSITDARYGGVGDGTTDNTAAFRRAIEDCSSRGGGHVIVPTGAYATGAILLLSNVDLHLEAGAILNFGGNVAEYPLVLTRYEGIECLNHSPMIYAYGQTNIAITGGGVLDGSGTRSWNGGSNRAGILEPLLQAQVAPEERIIPRYGRLRSTFVEPYRCANVLIQGVTLRHSQFWQIHPTLCSNVTVDGVTTGDTANPNSDGCNPESCDHVVIKNCMLAAYDDCVGIKSGRDADGRRVNTPCQDIVISGCRLEGPAGGIACGSEMAGGIRNLYAYDVQTYGASLRHMFYVKSNTRRGGYARNLNLDKVRADHLSGAWAFAQMDYGGQTGGYQPAFEDWTISHATGDFDPWILQLSGLDGNPIHRIRVSDSQFTHTIVPLDFLTSIDDISFQNVTINRREVTS
jgi:polygalacturonase